MHGTQGVCTYYIHSLLHRLGVHTVNHLSVANASIHMTHEYGHLQVLGTGGGYNEGDVYQSYYFVKYKALFMTRMTGMTRNMKIIRDNGTANKVSGKLSSLSLLS